VVLDVTSVTSPPSMFILQFCWSQRPIRWIANLMAVHRTEIVLRFKSYFFHLANSTDRHHAWRFIWIKNLGARQVRG